MERKLTFEEKAIFNQLKLENFYKYTNVEKGKSILRLKNKYKWSYREIEKMINIPKSTIQNWVTQRYIGQKMHISIDRMIQFLDGYKPKLEEFTKLEKLQKIIKDILELKYN